MFKHKAIIQESSVIKPKNTCNIGNYQTLPPCDLYIVFLFLMLFSLHRKWVGPGPGLDGWDRGLYVEHCPRRLERAVRLRWQCCCRDVEMQIPLVSDLLRFNHQLFSNIKFLQHSSLIKLFDIYPCYLRVIGMKSSHLK